MNILQIPKRTILSAAILIGLLGLLSGCSLLSSWQNPKSSVPSVPSSTGSSAPTGLGSPGGWLEGQLLIGYQDAPTLQRIVDELGGRVLDTIPQIRTAVIELPAGSGVPDAVSRLTREHPRGLRYVEPNYLRDLIAPRPTWPDPGEALAQGLSPQQDRRFNDPLRSRQYALDVMQAERAWERATGKGIIIGIVDTGIDGTHPELRGKQLPGLSCLDSELLLPDEDASQGEQAHATHVAGIAAATGNNSEGIIGVAPDAQIMNLRIFDARLARPGNSSGYVGDANVAKCLIWAVTIGPDGVENSGDEADVLNNSWGGRGYGQTLKEAIDAVVESGVVFVNSMGNSSEDEVLYPKGYPGVLAVGATDPQDRKVDFSTMGRQISVGAPGEDILSSVPLWIARPTGESYKYMYFSGTSMAAPQVTGAIALLKQLFPAATPYQLQKILEQTADDLENPGFDRRTGWGRINLARAVRATRLPQDGAEVVVKILTQNEGPDGEPIGAPYVDVILRQNGADRYFAQTNADGEARFLGIEPGDYTVIVGGGDATIYHFRTANRITARGRITAVSGARADLTLTFNTTLKITIRWSEPVDVDLLIGEPQPEKSAEGEVLSEWADVKTGARWGAFGPDATGSGAGPYRESYTLSEEHFPYAPYPIALSAEDAAATASVTVIVEQNGIPESYGPYRLQPGALLPSWEWFDWWENFPDPERGFEEPGPGAPWVY